MSSMLAEVESMDGLPFVKDTSPSLEPSEKIIAPSIEEVDSNPEELRSIRGQGRYFGLEDPADGIQELEPKCNNCSQRGHFKRNCPHVICSYCGSMDDHYSQHCPKAIKCANCNENGHYRSQCPHKWKRVYCTLCNSKKHSRNRCPSIWRSYFLLEGDSKRVLPMHKIFCYNCGGKGHFGDDCDFRRSSRVPNDDGSAFSGDNLPKKLKVEYYRQLNKSRREKSRFTSLYPSDTEDYDPFEVDDYEFDDAFYDDNVSSKSNKKRKRRGRNDGNSSFHPPPYQKSRYVPEPSSKGTVLPPKQKRKHPLDFDRSSGGNRPYDNITASRYGGASSYRQSQDNYRHYNSYQPFRSGTLGKRR
ncbi:LAFE_0B04126g1_1 [Lachancea fermentati]|uniref:LAFE_0B04126g1_1 n=1 Tax=Lachancea fermentati TaxID=4955 RepID=A0A1G4M7N8_LACFM|nr:LAFE_0B04126g1_1 [Lachancea fermentati]